MNKKIYNRTNFILFSIQVNTGCIINLCTGRFIYHGNIGYTKLNSVKSEMVIVARCYCHNNNNKNLKHASFIFGKPV